MRRVSFTYFMAGTLLKHANRHAPVSSRRPAIALAFFSRVSGREARSEGRTGEWNVLTQLDYVTYVLLRLEFSDGEI